MAEADHPITAETGPQELQEILESARVAQFHAAAPRMFGRPLAGRVLRNKVR